MGTNHLVFKPERGTLNPPEAGKPPNLFEDFINDFLRYPDSRTLAIFIVDQLAPEQRSQGTIFFVSCRLR